MDVSINTNRGARCWWHMRTTSCRFGQHTGSRFAGNEFCVYLPTPQTMGDKHDFERRTRHPPDSHPHTASALRSIATLC